MKKVSLLAVSAALAVASFVSSASAEVHKMECKCNENFAPSINNFDNASTDFTCAKTWSGGDEGHDTGGFNSYVKISYTEGYSSDNKTTIKVQPWNSGECLNAMYDAVNTHKEWSGAYCDIHSNLSVNDYDIVPANGSADWYIVSGRADTATKANQFAGIYSHKSDGNHVMAVCVENK